MKAGFFAEKQLQEDRLEVEKEVQKLPSEQQKVVEETQRLVDSEVEKMDDVLGMMDFLSTHHIPKVDQGLFIQRLKNTQKGKSFIFNTSQGEKSFHKTPLNQLVATDDYVYILEKALIANENVGFWKLILKAFSGLFKKLKGDHNE